MREYEILLMDWSSRENIKRYDWAKEYAKGIESRAQLEAQDKLVFTWGEIKALR